MSNNDSRDKPVDLDALDALAAAATGDVNHCPCSACGVAHALRNAYPALSAELRAARVAKERRFPIMGGPSIPWSLIAPHERQAQANHDQSLETLAARGGLSPIEAVAVLHDRPCPGHAERLAAGKAAPARLAAIVAAGSAGALDALRAADRERIAAMEAALRKHGRHISAAPPDDLGQPWLYEGSCSSYLAGHVDRPCPCDCGLADALASGTQALDAVKAEAVKPWREALFGMRRYVAEFADGPYGESLRFDAAADLARIDRLLADAPEGK